MNELFTNGQAAAEILRDTAFLNTNDRLRHKNLLEMPDYGQLVMTGDMHGNVRNFERLKTFCQLERHPNRHVILHELIHRESEDLVSEDDSIELLLLAAEYKCDFPEQVHFLQSNHELSQLTGNMIVKMGRSLLQAFEDAILRRYGKKAEAVLEAIRDYIASLPLAARTANGAFCAHSLPAPHKLESFDAGIFARDARPQDWLDGDVYKLVWGRGHTQHTLDRFAEMVDARFFIVGHTPQDDGYEVVGDKMIILASDHAQGVFLPIDLAKPLTLDKLVSSIRKLAEMDLLAQD